MAEPQGVNTLDTDFFTNAIRDVNNCNVCSELQVAVEDIFEDIADEEAAIQAELLRLAPILALLNIPKDLASVISWIENYITSVLTPMVKPHATYLAQLLKLAQEVAALTAAIDNAAAKLVNCTVAIPTLPTA